MNYLISGILIVVGIINILPVIGVISGAQLAALYGAMPDHPDMLILLRHRAVLFGLLGAFILAASVRSALQLWACVAGLVSMLSFIVIAGTTGNFGPELERIVMIDAIGCGGLVLILLLRQPGRASSLKTSLDE